MTASVLLIEIMRSVAGGGGGGGGEEGDYILFQMIKKENKTGVIAVGAAYLISDWKSVVR